MIKKVLILFSIIFFISCSEHKTESQKRWDEIKNRKISAVLNGVTLKHDFPIWSEEIKFFLNDSIILTRCMDCDTIFHLYTIDGNRLHEFKKFGCIGNGPNELLDYEICMDEKQKMLYWYGTLNSRINAYQIDITHINDTILVSPIHFPQKDNHFYGTMAPLGDSTFITLGGNIEKASFLTLFNVGENIVKNINISYPQDDAKVKALIKNSVYINGGILKRINKKQLLYYCNMGHYAEIITMDDENEVIKRTVLAADYPRYEIAADGINETYNMECYTGINAAVTENRIYLMLTPYRKKEIFEKSDYKGYPIFYCDELYVFDWDGNFIQAFQLNKPVARFVVNKDDSYFIASTINIEDGEIEIEKFSF
jgi:hypothetical protein